MIRTQLRPALISFALLSVILGLIYPLAVTNPIFVEATGTGYTPPGLPVNP